MLPQGRPTALRGRMKYVPGSSRQHMPKRHASHTPALLSLYRDQSTTVGARDGDVVMNDAPSAASPSQAPVANMLMPPQPSVKQKSVSGYVLQHGLDWGTITCSLACRIVPKGTDSKLHPRLSKLPDIVQIYFDNAPFARQALGWDPRGNFFFGPDLAREVRKGTIDQKDVIELPKLALYDVHETSDITKQVLKQLGDRTMKQLLIAHFMALDTHAREFLKTRRFQKFTPAQIDCMPSQLFLPVPEIWGFATNKTMVDAAYMAGFNGVEVLHESQSAAGFYAAHLSTKNAPYFAPGEVMIIADLGGGTGDFSAFEAVGEAIGQGDKGKVVYEVEMGAQVTLRHVGLAEGALCGSHIINLNLIEWLKEIYDTQAREQLCAELGLDETEFFRRASMAFDKIKESFMGPDYLLIEDSFHVKGAKGAVRQSIDIEITPADVADLFQPVIDNIIRCIDRQRHKRAKHVIIPGGFGKSSYLIEMLRENFEIQGLEVSGQAADDMPISSGSLQRYHVPKVRGLPTSETFGILQAEEWDPELHPDATLQLDMEMLDEEVPQERKPDLARVSFDETDNKTNVYDRWQALTLSGVLQDTDDTYAYELWEHRVVDIGTKEIIVQVYCADTHIDDHTSILRWGRDWTQGGRREDVKAFGEPVTLSLPDFEAEGFELKKRKGRGGAKAPGVWEFYYLIRLYGKGANVDVSVEIAKSGTQPFYKNGKPRPGSHPKFFSGRGHTLVSEQFNPNPRGNVG